MEGINDDKFGVGKTAKILFYLILKSMVQLMTQGTNPKGWGSLVRQAKESVLNAAESVLQAKVQGFAGKRFQSPDRQPLGYLQSQPKNQPAFSDFGSATKDMDSLRQQFFYQKHSLRQR